MEQNRILEIRNLKMYYQTRKGQARAVDDVSLDLNAGEALGVVGESGCGKTSLGMSIMRLLPYNARFLSGEILFDGFDLLKLGPAEMSKIRLKRISMILQSAMDALNPVFRVGDQLREGLKAHEDIPESRMNERIVEIFGLVDVPLSRLRSYPHELSGGMRQRVLIAMGLLLNPDLVIADEPTTALDVITQDRVLQLIKKMQKEKKVALILITHDIAVSMEMSDKIAVMYGGKVIEYGDADSVFRDPRHPYMIGLLRSVPSIRGGKKALVQIPGKPPDLVVPLPGCCFRPRCPIAREICQTKDPPASMIRSEHYSRCHFALDVDLENLRQEESMWEKMLL